jgi:hypothetical protein
MMKSRKVRWAGHAVRMRKMIHGNLKRRGTRKTCESVEGRIILMWIGFMWLSTGTGGGLL